MKSNRRLKDGTKITLKIKTSFNQENEKNEV